MLKELLEDYEETLSDIFTYSERTQEYEKCYQRYLGAKKLFKKLKGECTLDLLNSTNGLLVRRKPLKEELEEADKDFPLVGILIYRNLKGFIYLDDYGQQEFIKCNGKEWSGGAFNTSPEIDFSDFMDDIADELILKELFDKINK